jgi:hypothetical protein
LFLLLPTFNKTSTNFYSSLKMSLKTPSFAIKTNAHRNAHASAPSFTPKPHSRTPSTITKAEKDSKNALKSPRQRMPATAVKKEAKVPVTTPKSIPRSVPKSTAFTSGAAAFPTPTSREALCDSKCVQNWIKFRFVSRASQSPTTPRPGAFFPGPAGPGMAAGRHYYL